MYGDKGLILNSNKIYVLKINFRVKDRSEKPTGDTQFIG